MRDGDKLDDTFEWFILTVEGYSNDICFPSGLESRIAYCKKQIEAYRQGAKNTEQANQPDSGE